MPESDSPDRLAVLAARARAALAAAPAPADEWPETFAGTAAEGRIRAEVDAGGSVRRLTIDPAMHAAGLAEVAAAARDAINAALDARPAAPDLAPLVEQVRLAQAYARRTLGEVSNRMAEVEANLPRGRAGVPGWE